MPWTLLADGTLNGLSAANVGAVFGAPAARFFLACSLANYPRSSRDELSSYFGCCIVDSRVNMIEASPGKSPSLILWAGLRAGAGCKDSRGNGAIVLTAFCSVPDRCYYVRFMPSGWPSGA